MKSEVLHNKAIELAEAAFIHRMKGNIVLSIDSFRKAMEFEVAAAAEAKRSKVGEPTESILYRSAASLAFNAQEYRAAEKLVAAGLMGDPPTEIAEELRNLYEQINFERHLKLQGGTLSADEIQLVVAGNSVGYGMARSEEVFSRIDSFEKLTLRTIERKQKKPYREKGNFSKETRKLFEPYISVPRAASLAFTIRIGEPNNQVQIPGWEKSSEILDDVLENLQYINEGNEKEIKKRIKDEAYYRNFVSLAKDLAPDGERVNLVGLTVVRNSKAQNTQFTRTRETISMAITEFETQLQSESQKSNKRIELEGRLLAANSETKNISLKLADGKKKIIIVPEGLGDIVKKHFEENVRITGTPDGSKVRLIDLNPID